MNIEGACHCGKISFTAEIDPAQVMLCNCSDCQVLSGAPLRAIVPAALAHFKLVGEPRRYVKLADSGTRRVQAFCPECGTPVFACALENATHVTLRLGCVKQRAELRPGLQLWQRSAMPWLQDLAAVPGVPAQLPAAAAPPGRPA